ncbi:MAG: hypothetical protein ACRC62_03760 [Microcoleus sp.]
MATPSRYLIDLLLRTADDVETNPEYNWFDTECCNCGLLTKNAGLAFNAKDCGLTTGASWSVFANNTCSQTGRPLYDVIKQLIAIGLTTEDIGYLETCSNPAVMRKIGRKQLEASDADSVAVYLRAWASILDKQLAEQTLVAQGIAQQPVSCAIL